ncbi:UNVERIFIED_CONTAM: hypothetical protein HDU68_000315 [Siphonaria sp. JEL0065]|nr:hypothetical protein HDU68_000315 [Siphonaria sp. JEL0065]
MFAFDGQSGILASVLPTSPNQVRIRRIEDDTERVVAVAGTATCVGLVRLEYPSTKTKVVVFVGLSDGVAAFDAVTPSPLAAVVCVSFASNFSSGSSAVTALTCSVDSLVATLADGSFAVLDLHALWLNAGANAALLNYLVFTRFPPAPQQSNTARVVPLSPVAKWLPALLDAQPPLNTPCDRIPLPDESLPLKFITIGSEPMLSVLVSNSDTLSPADEMSQQLGEITASVDKLATAVVGAMFSFTKSMFSTSPASPESPALSSLPTIPGGLPNPSNQVIEASSPLSLFLKLDDRGRTIIQAVPAPFWYSSSPSCSSLVALLDSWGRVLVFNSNQCEVLQVIKGARDAQMAWFYDVDTNSWFLILLLGRGVLELYRLCVHSTEDGNTLNQLTSSLSDSFKEESQSSPLHPSSAILKRTHAISVGLEWHLVQSCPMFGGGNDDANYLQGQVVMVSKLSGTIKPVRIPSDTGPVNSPHSGKATISPALSSPKQILHHVEAECQSATTESVPSVTDFILGLEDVRLQTASLFIAIHHLSIQSLTPLSSQLYILASKKLLFNIETVSNPSILQSTQPNITRPFCTALLDLWGVQTCYFIIAKLIESTRRSIETPSVPQLSIGVENSIKVLVDSFRPASKPNDTLIETIDYSSLHQLFVLAFEAKYVVSDGSSKKQVLRNVLKTRLDSYALKSAGDVLFLGVLLGTVEISEWKLIVFGAGGGCFKGLDLARLFVVALENVVKRKESFIYRGQDVVSVVYRIVEVILEEFAHDGLAVFNLLVDFCWKSDVILAGFLLGNILQIVTTAQSFASLNTIDLDPLLTKLKDCFFIHNHFPVSISTSITPFNLGKTEKTSIPRLIALLQTTNTSTSPETLTKICNHFGPSLQPTVSIYVVRQHADQWLSSPQRMASLHSCLNALKTVTHPVLRNAVIIFLFHHVISMKLRALIEMIDKNRKAPKEQACMHNLGGMGVEAVLAFLEICQEMLGERLLIVEEGLKGGREIWEDLVESLMQFTASSAVGGSTGGLSGLEAYADDAFGGILGRIKGPSENGMEISRGIVHNHVVMLRVLKCIFTNGLKMVRPSRLFASSVVFGRTLFATHGDGDGSDEGVKEDEFAQVVNERALFQAKVEDKMLARQIFQ